MVKAFQKKSQKDYIHRQSASKKIVKTTEGESNVITSRILPMEDSYENFINYDSVKFRKIQKTTKLKTPISKSSLSKAIKALKLDIESKKNEQESSEEENIIILDIKMDQVPESYSIKPFQM